MAKKSIGKVKGTSKTSMAKIILPVRSSTGNYTFQARILPIEEAQKMLTKSI